jgi:ABC-2 type transport system permease protein
MNRIWALTTYYLTIVFRNKGRLVDIIAWPVLELLMFGFLSNFIASVSTGFTQAVVVILGALIFWHFFGRTMNEIVMAFTDDIYSRNLNNILITPLSTWELIVSLTLSGLIKLSANLIIVLPVSWWLYRLNIFDIGPMSIVYVSILTVWGISLGLLTAATHFIFGHRAGAFSWAIAGIIQPFSLVFYPRSILPSLANQISYLIPASYVFESFRYQAETQTADVNGIVTASILTGVYLALSAIIFYGSFEYSRRSGMIAKI